MVSVVNFFECDGNNLLLVNFKKCIFSKIVEKSFVAKIFFVVNFFGTKDVMEKILLLNLENNFCW